MAADDQPVDLDTDLVRQLARALSGLHRDVRDLSPLPRSAKYGTDSPDNTSVLDEYADAIWSEIIAARGGEVSIDARLDGYAALITSHNDEILAARGGEASIDARLDVSALLLGVPALTQKLDRLDLLGDLGIAKRGDGCLLLGTLGRQLLRGSRRRTL